MTSVSPKGASGVMAIPRSASSVFLFITGLVVFLVMASWILVDYPISSTFYTHLLSADGSRELMAPTFNSIAIESFSENAKPPCNGTQDTEPTLWSNGQNVAGPLFTHDVAETPKISESHVPENGTEGLQISMPTFPGFFNDSLSVKSAVPDFSNSTNSTAPLPTDFSADSDTVDSGRCDLYHGKWVYDPSGPLYTNNTCPIITQMQNCQGNGRPDRGYENWRWKPDKCDLPRFNPRKFLELMRGKTLAFISDSVARNQMESMICILWQAEVPKNQGNRHMQRWCFRSTNTMIVRIWSSWLVHQTSEPTEYAPEGVVKLHLDAPDENFMQLLPSFDVVILSSGHWFAKQSAYLLNNKVVGGQLWWPDKSRKMDTNNVEAFGISIETILSAIVSYPNYTGLVIVRSFSPDHYEGGAWNTGGSCTGKIAPATKLVRNDFTEVMHEKLVEGFKRALDKASTIVLS